MSTLENKHSPKARAKSRGKRAARLDNILSRTPAEIDAYVDAKVTTLAESIEMHKRTLKLIIMLAAED